MDFTQKDFSKFHRDASAELQALLNWWEASKNGAPARIVEDIELQISMLRDDVARYARLAGKS